jgi:hypothetical protein
MGAVTYPNPEVEQYLNAHFIPVQFDVMAQPEKMEELNSMWTPTIIVQDGEGKEHRRTQGYLDPQRFLGELALAQLKSAIDNGDFQAARQLSEEALQMTLGDSDREPEARYWASVAAYKATNDVNNLMQGWNRLLDQFPESEWAKRAEFIRS